MHVRGATSFPFAIRTIEMTNRFRFLPTARVARVLSCALCAIVLAGCAHTGSESPGENASPAPQPAAALAAIRAAGESLDSAVQVQPLRDAAIEGALARARAAEKAARPGEAVEQCEQALALDPTAPDILQYRAELAILQGKWADAERYALASFEHGPRVGTLCARNWQTVVEARTALDDEPTAAQARKRLAQCRVAPRLRM